MKDVIVDEISVAFHSGEFFPDKKDVPILLLAKSGLKWFLGNIENDLFIGGSSDFNVNWDKKQFKKNVEQWGYIND